MGAGEFRYMFDFLRSSVSYNEFNQPNKVSWAVAFTLHAQIMEESGREFISAHKAYSETTMLIKIRFTEKVREDMRVKYAGKTYEIVHISPPKEKRTVRLISLKGVK